uniref:FRIGIDA-like protein n=1 Tax=Callitropsis nootkatensis TaxID=85954 RepID=Q84NF6_9CONI|nr:ABI3-interacting protein 2 [Callitropsis nootkatensis]
MYNSYLFGMEMTCLCCSDRFESISGMELIVTAMESTTLKKELLQKSFEELDAHKGVMENCTIQWKELDEHFSYIDEALKKRFEELLEKEKQFEAKTSETWKVLEKHDEVVAAKEQASLSRVQEEKDAAVATIQEACAKKQKEAPIDSSSKSDGDGENKVNDSPVVMDIESNVPVSVKEEKSPNLDAPKSGPASEVTPHPLSKVKEEKSSDSDAPKSGTASEVKPRPQLKQCCEQMDPKGLLEFLAENRESGTVLREEVPAGLRLSVDPARLVLNALEGFYPPNQGNKTEHGLAARRRSCILLLECLVPLLGSDHPEVASDIKEQAKMIADDWKSKLADVDIDASNGNSLEAQAFLQLLATFGISSEYDADELCKLVLSVSRRKQTPELCQSLGLEEKLPGVMDTLINNGKQIEAVNFAFTCGLVDTYPPVPLLKAYLKEARKAAQVKSGNTSVAAQNEANARELFALKAVVKCIEEHNLESEYPSDTLRKRVLQLEKAKTDKKRSADGIKSQYKKPRTNTAGGYLPTASGIDRSGVFATANAADMSLYRSADRVQYPSSVLSANSYNLPVQSGYDRSSQGIYGTSSLPRSYAYSSDNLGSSALGSGSYNAASYNAGSYNAASYNGASYNGASNYSSYPGSGLPPVHPTSTRPTSAYTSSTYPTSNYPSSYLQ